MRDIEGRASCSMKGVSGSMGEMGRVESSMMEKVLVMDEEEKMDVDDIAIVIEGMKGVEIKSGELEQGIS